MPAVTKTEFASLLGVAKSYVSKLAAADRLVITAGGLVDVHLMVSRPAEIVGLFAPVADAITFHCPPGPRPILDAPAIARGNSLDCPISRSAPANGDHCQSEP